jgi:hypothetical protein
MLLEPLTPSHAYLVPIMADFCLVAFWIDMSHTSSLFRSNAHRRFLTITPELEACERRIQSRLAVGVMATPGSSWHAGVDRKLLPFPSTYG